jgi:hypothetical protein
MLLLNDNVSSIAGLAWHWPGWFCIARSNASVSLNKFVMCIATLNMAVTGQIDNIYVHLSPCLTLGLRS